MKKYIIKNADGSEQSEMQAIHESRKEAFVLESTSLITPDENVKVDSFEAALEYLGRENNACICGIPCKHSKAIVSMYKLITIAEAWNKADNFVPDYDNINQFKWFPWFQKRGTAGFVFADAHAAAASAAFGSRLCFKSSARASQFGKQFIDLWNEFLLFR